MGPQGPQIPFQQEEALIALASKGIVDAFPIQEQTIPLGLPGQDIIGQAKTGTGKTFGFGIPVVQRLGLDPEPGVKALIVVPTRELALQIDESFRVYGQHLSLRHKAIFDERLVRPFRFQQEVREYLYALDHLPLWRYAPDGALIDLIPDPEEP